MSNTIQGERRPKQTSARTASRFERPAGSLASDPRFQAFWMLRVAFTAIPLTFGIDKFFNGLVYWPMYLADWIHDILPGTPQQVMYGVGVVEILAGLLALVKPRYGAYVVAAWLAGIVIDLFSHGRWYDVAVRDLGLLGAALALGRLAAVYDPPLRLRRELVMRSRLAVKPVEKLEAEARHLHEIEHRGEAAETPLLAIAGVVGFVVLPVFLVVLGIALLAYYLAA